MAIPGRQILEQLQRALDESRAVASEADSSQKRLKSQIDQVVSERGSALLELARHDLPDLRRETIQNALAEIQRELLLIVERKEQTVSELSGRITRLLAAEKDRTQVRITVEAELVRAAELQKQLEAAVHAELQKDTEFPQLSQRAVEAEAALQRDEKRVAEVQAESAEKLPAYERSSLFQYLYRRGYLNPEYSSRGLTRRLDRWVSSLIEYPTAKRGYEFLKKTPEMMREELARRRDQFHALMTRVEEIEQQVADRLGLTVAIESVKSIREKREHLDQQIAESRQLAARAQSELAAVSQDQNPFYQAALDRYRQFLDSAQTAVLEQHAHQTSSRRDDEIVARLRGLSSTIDSLKRDLPEVAQRVTQALGISDGLEFVRRRLEQSNFDDANSRFEGLDLAPLLERFRQGVLSKDALWTELKQHQQFDRPAATDISAGDIASVIAHPMTRVLAQAMVEVVGAALQQGVNRSIQRRSGGSGDSWFPSFPTSSSSQPSSASGRSGGVKDEYTTVHRI